MKFKKNIQTSILVLIDMAFLAFSLAVALALRGAFDSSFTMSVSLIDYIYYFSPIFIIAVAIFYIYLSYSDTVLAYKKQSLPVLVKAFSLSVIIGLIYFYIFSAYIPISPKTIYALFVGVSFVVLIISRMIYAKLPLLGAHINAFVLIKDLPTLFEFSKFTGDHAPRATFIFSKITNAENIASEIEESETSLIIYDNADKEIISLISMLPTNIIHRMPVISKDEVYENIFGKIVLKNFTDEAILRDYLNKKPFFEFTKRVFDLCVAVPLFIISALFTAVACLAIFMEDGKPIFIFQDRLGVGRRIMRIPKLRTMTQNNNGVWLGESENKITRVGAFLRKTRLDELPQLWSVIKGDMSLIGPRPDMTGLEPRLAAEIDFYAVRYTVPPGLSGWAQVTQTIVPQSVEETRERFAYDMYYIKHRSILLDLSIALKTVRILLSRVGR